MVRRLEISESEKVCSTTTMICVTSPCPESTILALGLRDWPIWGCEISTFHWSYDQRETCLILEGKVTVTPDGGEPVRFGAGDLVVFPQGMSCTWEVHQPVRKHYQFG
jgi:hypothetical protein